MVSQPELAQDKNLEIPSGIDPGSLPGVRRPGAGALEAVADHDRGDMASHHPGATAMLAAVSGGASPGDLGPTSWLVAATIVALVV